MSYRLSCIVVEDEPETRLLLAQIVTMRGYTVRSAEDGFAALALMRIAVPDILISDLNMPGMSGFELLSVVRRLYPRIHVIATSGAYTGTEVPNGIAADAFHEKGTALASLFELLENSGSAGHGTLASVRKNAPLWVDLERRRPLEHDHVLINCSACLRPFRQNIDVINANIREAHCCYCGGKVAYAVALATKPLVSSVTRTEQPLPLGQDLMVSGNS